MKKLLVCSVLALSFAATAQEQGVVVEVDDVGTMSQAQDVGLNPELISKQIIFSRKDLEQRIGKKEADKMKPVSLNFKHVKASYVDGEEAKGLKGVLFITWGYNRGFHSKSDITVETEDGKYTIKDAVGDDRQSPLSLKYLDPSKITNPQYNVKIGYWFSQDSRFGVGVGTDHMKWVFDHTQEYEIEGYYNKDLWVKGEKKSFDEIIAGKDASFLLLEHTDGYNYPHIEGLYREKLINTKRFGVDVVGSVGAGVLFPKTRVRVADQENVATYRDVDNKFHVAGYAAHAELSLMLKYKTKRGVNYFVRPAAKGVAGKINNSLYLGSDTGVISQSTIYTFEPMLSFGAEIPLENISNIFKKKRNRK